MQHSPVLWLVPTLKLADETLAAMQALGLRAALFRGRDAAVPGAVEFDLEDDIKPERMCLDLEAVEDAMSIGAVIEQSVCGSTKDGWDHCPFSGHCQYQKQKASGRPLPQVLELREMALALTGRPVQIEAGRQETRGMLMADGSGAGINVRACDDPDLEALRVAVIQAEAEVIQAIGWGRGSTRQSRRRWTSTCSQTSWRRCR